LRSGEDLGAMAIDDAIELIGKVNAAKSLDLVP